MTIGSHDEIRAALSDYALGALDPPERAEVDAHVSACAPCQAELAEIRTVVAGIGAATEAAPPASLRARVLQHATAGGARQPGVIAAPIAVHDVPRRRFMEYALAASIVFGLLAAGYAWSLRMQLRSTQQLAANAGSYAEALRGELLAARREAAQLSRAVGVLGAPNLLRVDLKGQPTASGASGRAFWSPTMGVFFSASGLPSLEAGRVYQLWTIKGTTATSAGTMTPDAKGLIVHAAAGPTERPDAFGVTVEPAGGSAAPTLPVIMLGRTD